MVAQRWATSAARSPARVCTVALHTGRGQVDGANLEDHNVLVIDCEGGRVREVWEHHENLYDVDAF